MYNLTPPNSPNHKSLLPIQKTQTPSVTLNSASQHPLRAKNTPLFGQDRRPKYAPDVYESLGLEKLSIARNIKNEIDDDLSDAEFFTNKAKKELEIAKKKERDSKRLEHKARTSLFHRSAYQREALRTKESMFFHEDNANTAAVQSKLANKDAQEKTKERKALLDDGNFLLDYADQIKPKYYQPHTYSAGHRSTSAQAPSSSTYRRGTFPMPKPDTIFEEEEGESSFNPPPPPRRHSYSAKSHFPAPQPSQRPKYYYYAKPEEPTSSQERHQERSFNSFQTSFSQRKSYTFPLGAEQAGQPPLREHKRPQPPKDFSTSKNRASTWDGSQEDPALNQKEPPFIDPSFSWEYVYANGSANQGESSKAYYEEPESYETRKPSKAYYEEPRSYETRKPSKAYYEDPTSYGQKRPFYTKTAKGGYVPPVQKTPVKPPVFVEPNEKNFKYENWMPEKWQTFTKVPVAIKDVYETKELGQLFSIAVKGIVHPTETKLVQVEENGEKKSRIRVKTSKELFRDWKVKTHSDKASQEDAKIYAALGVLFDAGDKQVYEFNKEGQAIRVRRKK